LARLSVPASNGNAALVNGPAAAFSKGIGASRRGHRNRVRPVARLDGTLARRDVAIAERIPRFLPVLI
jgi:hypothetical protein